MLSKTKKLAELLGIIFGDGCLSRSGNRYMLYICGHKVDDLPFFENVVVGLIRDILKKEVKIGFRKGENTIFIRFSDKRIFYYLTTLGVPVGYKYEQLEVPKLVKNTEKFPFFVRGLFATDGCIILSKQHREKPYYPRIEITSKSKSFLSDILLGLRSYGFYGSVSLKGVNAYRLEIPGNANLAKWHRNIGFANIKHINKIRGFVT